MNMRDAISANRTFLMGLAMIAILLYHHGYCIIPGITAFFSRFGLFGVDIFLFLSGFGCVFALSKTTPSVFFGKRIARLLPTCLFVGMTVFAADLFLDAERTDANPVIALFSLHRWYIQAIIICYLICPVAYFLLKRYKLIAFIGLLAASALGHYFSVDIDYFRLSWIMGRLPVFFVGMYIAMYNPKTNGIYYCLSVALILASMLIRCVGGGYVFLWTYTIAAGMPILCLMLASIRNLSDKIRLTPVISLFGLYSLEIYLIHEYTYWTIGELSISLWIKYTITIAIIASVSMLSHKVTNSIKPIIEKRILVKL